MGGEDVEKKDWLKRILIRTDETTELVHLTKPYNGKSTIEVLFQILIDKELKPDDRNGYVGSKVCCFQEVPILCIAQNQYFEYQLYREDNNDRYRACGIRVAKKMVFESGGLPVIYTKEKRNESKIDDEQKWRHARIDFSNENLVDFTHEREWRINHEFKFDYKDISIILPYRRTYKQFLQLCDKNNRQDIYHQCRSIIVLEDIIR